jgi:hypothetical protein
MRAKNITYLALHCQITILGMEKPLLCARIFCPSSMLVFRNVKIPEWARDTMYWPLQLYKRTDASSLSQISCWISNALIQRLGASSLVLQYESASSPF